MAPRLPYDVLRLIFEFMNPLAEEEVAEEAGFSLRTASASQLALQRSLGATLSLVSRDWRDLGAKYLWSNFILSFHKANHEKRLVLLLGNEDIAKTVKRLCVFGGRDGFDRALTLPLELLLPSLPNLRALEGISSMELAHKLFSGTVAPSIDLGHLQYFDLVVMSTTSAHIAGFVINLVKKLHNVTILKLAFPVPASGTFESIADIPVRLRPLQRLKSLACSVHIMNAPTSSLTIPFLTSLLNLVNPSPVEHLSLSATTIPDTLAKTLGEYRNLVSLRLACHVSTMRQYISTIVSVLPSLEKLSELEFGIAPTWMAPWHLESDSHLPANLFASLGRLTLLRTVRLDLDFSSHEQLVRDFLVQQWSKGVLRRFDTMTWIAVSRNRVPITYERSSEGGWRREELGHSIETFGTGVEP
ncbi:hypothetical protein JCM3766R1_007205 [Sporobolomyces carnicolor]